jgi:16S rRNA (cytosine967-C5)-methyltransferase
LATTIYKNLVKTTAAGIKRVFLDGQHAEMVLEKLLASDKRLGARDRRFIAETFYDMVRFRRHLEILQERIQVPLNKDAFLMVSAWLIHKGHSLREWPECASLIEEELQKPIEGLGAKEISVPDWLWETGLEELGNRWPAEIQALNEPAPIYLRVNSLKGSLEELLQVLETEGVEAFPVEGHPWAIRLGGRTNVLRLGSFRKGLYEVQDAASQRISPFLETEPGQLVIDACAGAGGKSLHLAALMGDAGRIVSMDVEAWKLNEVKKRASRAGIKCINTELINGQKTLKYWKGKADRLLLDAPCSGLGVLRRHPDTKWKLSPEALENVKEVQADILDRYCEMLKPGGKLVYATCSLMPGENEQQVERFLEEHPEFVLEEQVRTWPSEGWDGFFMARMRKED